MAIDGFRAPVTWRLQRFRGPVTWRLMGLGRQLHGDCKGLGASYKEIDGLSAPIRGGFLEG